MLVSEIYRKCQWLRLCDVLVCLQREAAMMRHHHKTKAMLEDREQNLELQARRHEQAQTRLQQEYERRERQIEQEHIRMERRYDELQSELMRAYSGPRTNNSVPGRRLRPPSSHWSSRPSSARQ